MRRTITTTLTSAVLLAALAACSSDKVQTHPSVTGHAGASASTASEAIDAGAAFQQISSKVDSAKLSGTVTAANDPNHLLGRPNQYTSKVTFTDSLINPSDVEGTQKGDVGRGGAVEVFATAADAEARAEYIQKVTKSMPALTEYDYVHGAIVVRVSHYLTPSQAAGYKSAVNGLG